jgi:E3 SUMO-protein ligase PIAS1
MATTFPSSVAGAGPASLPAPTRRDVEELVRQIRSPTFYNRQLSSICQVNGLKSTGVKADLQRRITDRESPAITFPSHVPPSNHQLLTLVLTHKQSHSVMDSVSTIAPSQSFLLVVRARLTYSYPYVVIQLAFSSGNITQFHQIRQSIDNAAGTMTKRASPAKPAPSRSAPHLNQPATPVYNGGSTSNGYPQSFGSHSRGPAHRGGLQFHPSPFYTIEAPITDVLSCPGKMLPGGRIPLLAALLF